jgi:hypothetical protein
MSTKADEHMAAVSTQAEQAKTCAVSFESTFASQQQESTNQLANQSQSIVGAINTCSYASNKLYQHAGAYIAQASAVQAKNAGQQQSQLVSAASQMQALIAQSNIAFSAVSQMYVQRLLLRGEAIQQVDSAHV